MSILLTGGTGKTGIRLAHLLHAANRSVILTSRKGVVPEPFRGVKFDWHDPVTFENPFTIDSAIESVHLVSPPSTADILGRMKPFIDLANRKGVKRFVFLSASGSEAGGPGMGKVHEYLLTLGVDFFVVRPSWFFGNFITMRWHRESITHKGTIMSASGDGKMGFVAADDIAELAFDALTTSESYNTDRIIVGPELLSYDEVAKTFSEVLGREITHTRLTAEEMRKVFISYGESESHAKEFAYLETFNANGGEEKSYADERKVIGKRTLRSFVEVNKDAWSV